MLELNHILRGEDLLSGSSGPQLETPTSGSPVIFDLKAGGLFKIDAKKEEDKWKNS